MHMVSVPTKNSASDAAKSGASAGVPAGLGAAFGRSMLGPGLGTAIGGVAGASMLDGGDRDTMASIAVYDAVNELLAGASASGGTNEQVM